MSLKIKKRILKKIKIKNELLDENLQNFISSYEDYNSIINLSNTTTNYNNKYINLIRLCNNGQDLENLLKKISLEIFESENKEKSWKNLMIINSLVKKGIIKKYTKINYYKDENKVLDIEINNLKKQENELKEQLFIESNKLNNIYGTCNINNNLRFHGDDIF